MKKDPIAFLIPSRILAGGVLVTLEHVKRLADKGHDVVVILRSDARYTNISPTDDLEVPVISWDQALEQSYELVVSTWWETAFDMYDLRSKHYAYFVQSDERRFYQDFEDLSSVFAGYSYTLPCHYITEAKWIRAMLADEFGQDAALAPNGVCPEVFFPSTPITPKSPKLRVLLEGPGAAPFKRIDLAFQVVHEVDDIEVWYVSTDGVKRPEWRADRIFDTQPQGQMRYIYSACDVLLKLSTVEGFFGPPLEMMACGGTAVVSKVSGYDEYIVDGQNALAVDMDDKKAAIEAIKKLRDDRELYKSLCAAGMKTAKSMSWDDSNVQFEKFVLDCLAGTACSPKDVIQQRQLALFRRGLQRKINSLSSEVNALRGQLMQNT